MFFLFFPSRRVLPLVVLGGDVSVIPGEIKPFHLPLTKSGTGGFHFGLSVVQNGNVF